MAVTPNVPSAELGSGDFSAVVGTPRFGAVVRPAAAPRASVQLDPGYVAARSSVPSAALGVAAPAARTVAQAPVATLEPTAPRAQVQDPALEIVLGLFNRLKAVISSSRLSGLVRIGPFRPPPPPTVLVDDDQVEFADDDGTSFRL